MKLIIQIPCFNEEADIAAAIRALPKKIPGIQKVEVLVIDDGSRDGTAEAARKARAHHIVRLPSHRGLAEAFRTGLDACLARGADIIVNTDADNQYEAADIPKLVEPILAGRAELVVGDRDVLHNPNFSALKRLLQWLGSLVIRLASGKRTPDATSGFRALSRDAALRTVVLSRYSYTLETLIQAGSADLPVEFVRVRTHPAVRPSRLMRNIPQYLAFSGATILRAYTMYRPLRVFSLVGGLFLAGGLALAFRYMIFFFEGTGSGHVQSVILSAVLLLVGAQVLLIGLVADLIQFNRRMLEDWMYRERSRELEET